MNFKNRICLLPLALAALATPAFASPDVGVVSTGFTNRVTPSVVTSANLGNAVDVSKQHEMAVLIQFKPDASSTDLLIVQLARGVGGVFETLPPSSLKFTNTAVTVGTAVVGYHQIPRDLIASCDQLKVAWATNSGATVNFTNVSSATNIVQIIKKSEPR